jgi:hypothetical protein
MKSSRLILTLALLIFCGMAVASSSGQETSPEIPDEVLRLLFEDVCRKECSDEEVALWKSNLKYETHDLNGDASLEFFVFIDHSDWCGAGSNCSYWIFQKGERGYTLLLNDKVLRVKDRATNGYRDLASETPMGFCSRNLQRLYVTPYVYDGKEYRAQPHKMECRPFTPPVE